MRIYLGIAVLLWTSACLTADFDRIERRNHSRADSSSDAAGSDAEQPGSGGAQVGRSAAAGSGGVAGQSAQTGQADPSSGSRGQAGQDDGKTSAGAGPSGAGAEEGDADVCIDTTRDPHNCGSCGNDCDARNALVSCEASECVRVCESGRGDCDADLQFGARGTGCEVNLKSDVDHCGACNARCAPQAGQVASCEDSSCVYTLVEIGTGTSAGEVHGSLKGGSPFEQICGRNRVLVGLDLAADDYVAYGAGFICAPLLLSGQSNAYVIGTSEELEVLPMIGNTVVPPAKVERRLCPAGAVITGLTGATWHYNNTQSELSVKQLGVQCSQLTLDSKNAINLGPGGLITGGDLRSYAELFTDTCDSGEVAVGMMGRAGAYIDSIQLYCGSIALGQQTARATTSK